MPGDPASSHHDAGRRTPSRGRKGVSRLFTSVVVVPGRPLRTLFHAAHARSLGEVEARLAARIAAFPLGEVVTIAGIDPVDPIARQLLGAGTVALLHRTGDMPSGALARGGELAVWQLQDAHTDAQGTWAWSEGGPMPVLQPPPPFQRCDHGRR
jgi:hypothetical protein